MSNNITSRKKVHKNTVYTKMTLTLPWKLCQFPANYGKITPQEQEEGIDRALHAAGIMDKLLRKTIEKIRMSFL